MNKHKIIEALKAQSGLGQYSYFEDGTYCSLGAMAVAAGIELPHRTWNDMRIKSSLVKKFADSLSEVYEIPPSWLSIMQKENDKGFTSNRERLDHMISFIEEL